MNPERERCFRPETLVERDDLRVRVMCLEGGESTRWHHHSQVADEMLGLSGDLQVELAGRERPVSLQPGERCTLPPGVVHRVRNAGSIAGCYLLVQGGGAYDFLVAD